MKTWLDRICEPLEHPKYPQVHCVLIRRDKDGTIIGKCAEGEIACQNGIKLDRDTGYMDKTELINLGVPDDLLFGLPYLCHDGSFSDEEDSSIGDYLWRLNDYGLTYPELVEFLRTTFEDSI